METLFLHLVNMSLSASPLILLVVLARWLMKRTPRWIICLLWAVVALRLICPFSFESPVGVMPNQPTVTEELVNEAFPGITLTEMVTPEITPAAPAAPIPAEPLPEQLTVTEIAAFVWAAGVAGMLLYLLGSYLRMRHLVREAVPIDNGVWLCDAVKTPFILGVVFPKIYLPSGIRESDMGYVLAHERAHLKRKDHWWKPFGFLLLAEFWFNPLVWVAYVLMCKDIELACDEKVIRNLGMTGKKAYSTALLECSSPKKLVFACPVAFGEVAVKDRIRNILNYKKPGFWIILVSLVLVVVGAVCFMATPPQPEEEPEAPVQQETIQPESTVSAEEPETLVEPENTQPAFSTADGEWAEYPDGIRIETVYGQTYTAHVMLIRDPSQIYMGLSTQEGFSNEIPGKRINQAIEDEGAIAAINAGGFFDDGTASSQVGSTPLGLVVSDGKTVWTEGEQPGLKGFAGFNEDNILVVSQSNLDEDQAAALKIRDGCCFGPALIINGEENAAAYNDNSGYNPRTAIGQRADGAVIFVCIDGRRVDSLGGTYADIIDIMQEFGAVNACNMDGGSSSAMMYRDVGGRYGEPGEVQMINSPSLLQSEPRRIPNFWMVRPQGMDSPAGGGK